MAHITLNNDFPGIGGLLRDFPDTAAHIRGLVHTLTQGTDTLSSAERELIAAYVSSGNECRFCSMSHAAAARAHYGDDAAGVVDDVLRDVSTADISHRMQALLAIADKVRRDGRLVTAEDVQRAREAGADDATIHDTVLLAAMFCMANRYVDGLGTWAPQNPEDYVEMGKSMAEHGYVAAKRA